MHRQLLRLLSIAALGTVTWGMFRTMGWGIATVEGLLAFYAGALLMVDLKIGAIQPR